MRLRIPSGLGCSSASASRPKLTQCYREISLEVVDVTDILVRDVPDDVVSALDARAAKLGLSRTEFSAGGWPKKRLRASRCLWMTSLPSPTPSPTLATLGHEGCLGLTEWLIDASALSRISTSPDGPEWVARVERGLVRITTVTCLEVGYSARTGSDLRTSARRSPMSWMPIEYQTPAIEDRAIEVQMLLGARGSTERRPSLT